MGKISFYERCYRLLKKVPFGKVTTYKEIARKLNSSGYRAVGKAMKMNKDLVNVPCYKVVCSDGEIGGYSRGVKKKIELLKKDGVKVVNGRVDLEKYFYRFR
jgi:O-6-methylguanine DNA methyltransferase